MTHAKDPRIDAYIQDFSPDTQDRLNALRKVIREAFPASIEDISYKMPAWRLKPGKRPVVFFSAYEKHIGLYAVLAPDDSKLYAQIAPYNTGKGTLRFDNDKPLPLELIKKVLVAYAQQITK